MASEDLYELRNALFLGNYSQVISEGTQIKANQYKRAEENEILLGERDYLIAKAQIGRRENNLAISDLRQKSDPTLKALLCLAEYLKAQTAGVADAQTRAVEQVTDLVKRSLEDEGEANEKNARLCVTASTVLIHEGNYEQALEWLKSWATSLHTKAKEETGGATPAEQMGSSGGINALLLEVHALCVDIFLRMNRPDFAEAELKHMMKIDDDAPLTTLFHGWVALRKSSDEQVKEAEGLFEDLKEKFGHTAMLLNGTALCMMAQNRWAEAEKVLEEALMGPGANDPDTMINLMICKKQLKPDHDTTQMMDMVKSCAPAHQWVRRITALEQGFDEAAERASY